MFRRSLAEAHSTALTCFPRMRSQPNEKDKLKVKLQTSVWRLLPPYSSSLLDCSVSSNCSLCSLTIISRFTIGTYKTYSSHFSMDNLQAKRRLKGARKKEMQTSIQPIIPPQLSPDWSHMPPFLTSRFQPSDGKWHFLSDFLLLTNIPTFVRYFHCSNMGSLCSNLDSIAVSVFVLRRAGLSMQTLHRPLVLGWH